MFGFSTPLSTPSDGYGDPTVAHHTHAELAKLGCRLADFLFLILLRVFPERFGGDRPFTSFFAVPRPHGSTWQDQVDGRGLLRGRLARRRIRQPTYTSARLSWAKISVMRILRKSQNPSLAGVAAVGLAIGATAIGALAIGAIAIGRMAIRQGRIEKLSIGELTVEKLIVREQITATPN